MESLGLFFSGLTGGFSNRVIRGTAENVSGIYGGDVLNALIFAVMSGLIFAFHNVGHTFSLWHGLTLLIGSAVAMYVGMMPGWGKYIQALAGQPMAATDFSEWAPIDFVIGWAKKWPMLWGFLGMTLRGGFIGLLISIIHMVAGLHIDARTTTGFMQYLHWVYINLNVVALIGSLTMGLVYGITIHIMKAAFPDRNWEGEGWEQGEAGYGAVLWGAAYVGVAAIFNIVI